MSPKRACDTCISRKVRCNGSWPCNTCRGAVKKVECTFLRPARKRGPKFRRTSQPDVPLSLPRSENEHQAQEHESGVSDGAATSEIPETSTHRISKSILEPVVGLYRRYSYSVWPVINADALLPKIEDIDPETVDHHAQNTSCLITALCAATMAQLHLDPQVAGSCTMDGRAMAQACLQMRAKCYDHGEHMDVQSILASFFLHVYHAKVNQQNSAMMYIQEAIAGARILRLDKGACSRQNEIISNAALVFPLLWVSERGYALHLGLSPSYNEPLSIAGVESDDEIDTDAQGLLELAKLFIAFERISVCRKSSNGSAAAADLTDTEKRLSSLCFSLTDCVSTRTADYHITREWMRTILWQEALSMGLLSSSSDSNVMTFVFPAQVGRDLLQALRLFSETDLLPLGRDQLLKCFEVANSLADTVLFNSSGASSRLELGPQDFLHALYQKIVPFLNQDNMLKSILRAKTAEALVMAPARLLTRELGGADLLSPRRDDVSADVSEHAFCEDLGRYTQSLDMFNWLSGPNQQDMDVQVNPF